IPIRKAIVPDIAFNFKPDNPLKAYSVLRKAGVVKSQDFVVICPNVNIYLKHKSKYIALLIDIIKYLEEKGIEYLLLEHSIWDKIIVKKIKELDSSIKIKDFPWANYSPRFLKAVLGLAKIVITSRYHSAIASFSLGVPTIMLSWAHKYEELAALFQLDYLAVKEQDLNFKSIITLFNDVYNRRDEITKQIKNKIPFIKATARLPIALVKLLLLDKMVENIRKIEDVGNLSICCSCGTCEGICPQCAIKMKLDPAGRKIIPDVNSDKCNNCGICLSACPAIYVYKSSKNNSFFNSFDLFLGKFQDVQVGHIKDLNVRIRSQSGGFISALTYQLLKTGNAPAITAAVSTQKNPFIPEPRLITRLPDLAHITGSKYAPVPMNILIPRIINETKKTCYIGTPCQVLGLLLAMKKGKPALKNRIYLIIGLSCGGMLNLKFIDEVLRIAGVEREQVALFKYRDKSARGWPGDISITLKNGQTKYISRQTRLKLKNKYLMKLCRNCYLKMNPTTDITCGDAWGFSKSYLGDSLVITRTPRGERALQDLKQAGSFISRKVHPADVIIHQKPFIKVLKGSTRILDRLILQLLSFIDKILMKDPFHGFLLRCIYLLLFKKAIRCPGLIKNRIVNFHS
ncbi:MAG: Coenzyme F420 hydrogenase/dehydrogenase, beta subunit C-terminal domain, partial [Promethearchaeota archaeon]